MSTKAEKTLFFGFIFFVTLIFLVGCLSTPEPVDKPEESKANTPKEEVVEQKKHDVHETTSVEDEPTLTLTIPEAVDDEYTRSVKAIQTNEVISPDTFAEDKKAILQTIEELDLIMKNRDYNSWLNYVTPQSIDYWKQKSHLQAVSARLPGNKIQLKTLEDYFNWVFRLSRQNARVDEIRYISSKLVKAVQVSGNQDIIYYQFEKQNGRWLISLDTIDL
ncbi:MAG: hypothetical protein J6K22_00685 [Spirochaetaceae bacterium]|nr:hypothetical protein [Spirochaetaceae bacterium]